MRNKRSVIAAILWLYFAFQECSAFSTSPSGHLRPSPSVTRTRAINPKRSKVVLSALNDTHNITPKSSSGKAIVQNRREWIKTLFSTLLVAIGNSNIQPVWAANGGDTVWKTGKSPEVPGQKPKDKGDVKGTKKDPSFLRSVSDCRSKCEGSYGPDGMGKTSAECLAECQDICCTTYEQCTFAIVPR